jgi:hypothetical protein
MLTASSQLYLNNPVGRVLKLLYGYAYITYGPGSCQKHRLRALFSHTAQFLRCWHKLSGGQRLITSLPLAGPVGIDYRLTAKRRGTSAIYGLPPVQPRKSGAGMFATIAC